MLKKHRYRIISSIIVIATITFLFYFINSPEKLPHSSFPFDDELNRYNRDDNKLFDLNFAYLINSRGCDPRTEYLAAIVIHSYLGNVEARSSMRRAFGREDLKEFGVKRVFLLGEGKDRFVTQEAIENEAERFGDIIQGNFREAYRNLTYKHSMGLRWVAEFCPEVTYVIKMDDDVVIDMKKIIKMLNSTNSTNLTDRFLAGNVMEGMKPKRDPSNKWFVTNEEYPEEVYPPFVSGWFYYTTPKIAKELAELANQNKYFWIDDVYITGILTKKTNTTFIKLNKYFAVHSELMQCCLKDFPDVDCDFLIGPNGGDNNMFYDFNKLSAECAAKNCSDRIVPLEKTCVLEKSFRADKGNAVIKPYNLVG